MISTKGKLISIHFNSLGELMTAKPSNPHNQGNFDYVKTRPATFFLGDMNAEQVIQKAVVGDESLLKMLHKKASRLAQGEYTSTSIETVQKRKRKRIKGAQGDELDIHAVYQGKLDRAWSSRKHVEIDAQASLYTVMIDVGATVAVGVDESMWRAVVAHKVADELITAGKSVRIIVGSGARNVISGSRIVTTDIVVKNYNEPLSMERLAAMSHAGFHRVFNFMARCMVEQNVNQSMGSSFNYLKDHRPAHMEDSEEYIYVAQSVNEYQAKHNIKEIFDKIRAK